LSTGSLFERHATMNERTAMSHRSGYAAVIVLALAPAVWGQSLSISPSSAKPGGSGSMLLRFESTAAQPLASLQWEFLFPEKVTVEIGDIVAGSAAESARKLLACAAVKNAKQAGKSIAIRCILAGGQAPVPNGPIAAVRFRIPQKTRPFSDQVRVQNISGVTADLKMIDIAAAQGSITVR
jgi:hypothetical protein